MTFHTVSVLSRVVLATLSCLTFTNRLYVVGTGEGPLGSSTTEKGCQGIIQIGNELTHSLSFPDPSMGS